MNLHILRLSSLWHSGTDLKTDEQQYSSGFVQRCWDNHETQLTVTPCLLAERAHGIRSSESANNLQIKVIAAARVHAARASVG